MTVDILSMGIYLDIICSSSEVRVQGHMMKNVPFLAESEIGKTVEKSGPELETVRK